MKKLTLLFLSSLIVFTQSCAYSEKSKEESEAPQQRQLIYNSEKKINSNLRQDKSEITDKPSYHEPIYVKPVKNKINSSENSIINQSDTKRHDDNFNTEEYDRIYENEFQDVLNKPLSTFSIDVDTASYSNIRRFINNNSLPPKDAVRIEEMINYFSYDYPQPKNNDPFSINIDSGNCPWNEESKLIKIGLQGKEIEKEGLPSSNLVFLLDVSGSMNSSNKLPLLKSAFSLLTEELRENDTVSIVVYAGSAGLVLPPTSGYNKEDILEAFEKLQAGGSTAGGEGINLAYKIAKENFIENGNNRVILATDGDFNVGISSDGELTRLIEEKRNEGIFLTVLGFGSGNYKDSKMEKLADKGNGNYAYIDNLKEAKKVLVDELGGTLFTIAKDVKIQIEFNPAKIKSYKLIGYENRLLEDKDFDDDKKDAGDLGSGHKVTALYEVMLNKDISKLNKNLKYQETKIKNISLNSSELLTIKLRYKDPQELNSKLITKTVNTDIFNKQETQDFKFSSAVASLGLILRDSKYKENLSYEKVLHIANLSKGQDKKGYRKDFINLIKKIQSL